MSTRFGSRSTRPVSTGTDSKGPCSPRTPSSRSRTGPNWRSGGRGDDRPARRLEARRRGRRRGGGGRRRHGLHSQTPLPPLRVDSRGSVPQEVLAATVTLARGMARRYPNVLELVGGTPIVRLDRFGAEVAPTLLAKLEYLNPGGSVKDRIGLAMIEAAEREGKLQPGRHYRRADLGQHRRRACDRGRAEGLPLHLRHARQDEPGEDLAAAGLRCRGRRSARPPLNADSPESYYSVSERLAARSRAASSPTSTRTWRTRRRTTRRQAPRSGTRPDGEIDALRHLRSGTGGTIIGVGALLQGAQAGDPDRRRRSGGLHLHGGRRPPVHPYLVEGIGKDSWPETMDPARRRRVGAGVRPGLLPHARRLAREEGLLVGWLWRDDGLGRAAAWRAARSGGAWSSMLSRHRPLLPRPSSTTTTGCSSTASSSGARRRPPSRRCCASAAPRTRRRPTWSRSNRTTRSVPRSS